MGLPPLEAGAVQVTVAWALPAVATGLSTALGGPCGVAGVVVAAGPAPTALRAVMVKVYWVPLVSPVTTQVRATVVQDWPPGDDVTV